MTSGFVKFVDRLVKAQLAVSAVLGFVIGILVFVSAMFRYIGNTPIGFSDELVALLFVLATFFTLPYAARSGINIRLDIATKRLSKRHQETLAQITTFVGLIILALLAWYSIEEIQYSLEFSEVSEVAEIPVSPVKALAVFALASTALALFTNLIVGEDVTEVEPGTSEMIE